MRRAFARAMVTIQGAGAGLGGDLLKVESRTADVDALKAQVLPTRGVVEENATAS